METTVLPFFRHFKLSSGSTPRQNESITILYLYLYENRTYKEFAFESHFERL